MRLIAALLCLSLFCPVAGAANAYLDELLTAAARRHLAASAEWHALLHYRRNLFGGYTSEAITPSFFLSPDGRGDPAAELRATLASFFAPPPANRPDDASQCRFIARYDWLRRELHFDPARLPPRPCPEFQRWYRAIHPGRLVLVYPAAYLNNPSSMYGHTFLRFDHPGQPEDTHLESYAVNYAAQTNETNGVLFAIKGLSGLYTGRYALRPYYKSVRAYSDIENRDMWEYELNYSPAEIRLILEHVWELRQVSFRYYFFDRNCSYAVLALLDVARPQAHLVDRFFYQVIPGDSVKAVLAQKGVLLRVVYRPSLRARIAWRAHFLNPAEQTLARRIARGALAPGDAEIAVLAPARRALIYDTAADWLLYQSNRAGFRGNDGARTLAILRARSALGSDPELPPVPAPDTDPASGHGSSRLAFGLGRLGGGDYRELELRAAYHDLLDPAAGFVDGAEIEMFALSARQTLADGRTHLEALNFVDIVSLAPRDAFFRPLSWALGVSRSRQWISANQRPLVNELRGGLGVSRRLGDGVLAYALAGGTLLAGAPVPKGWDWGIGPDAGLLWRVTPRWNLLADVSVRRYPRRLGLTSVHYGLGQNFALARNLSLRLSLDREGSAHAPVSNLSLSLLWYF